MKQKFYIDTHKGVTPLAILAMMALHNQWQNSTAWIYLALHGTYGILWVLKSRFFPDKQWEQQASLWYGLFIWGGLTLYWAAPWLLAANNIQVPPWYLGLCVTLYGFGVFFHFASDMQKHTWLHLRPGQLIKTGLWARCRNPNYFGELLIYLGFGLLAMHWLPIMIIILYLAMIWLPNMRKKDRSLSRYPDFSDYRANSKMLIPYLF
jgi:protein-S-isoprenylcysteine O-methyltransferase Ste14